MTTQTMILWIGTPLIGGLIGWFTNYLAVKMLFRPRQQYRFLGIRFQGLIPKRQDEIAESISQTVAKELLTVSDVKDALVSESMQNKFSGILNSKLATIFQEKIEELPSMIAAMVPPALTESIQQYMIKEIMETLPSLIDDLADHMENKSHFQDVVKNKISAFELDKLETMVLRIAGKELRHIEILGGLLGAAIGLVNAFLIHSFAL